MGKTRDYNGLADYIIQEEGFLDKPTNIGDGKITLGSGLTDPKWHNLYKQRGNKWSKEDNKKAVIEEIKMREKILADSFPNWDKLPIDSQNALISYKYNYNFTPSNSPKLYQAARDFNYLNMAAQMDVTSKDPKFRKGLMERRKREQEMFLSGFPSGRNIVRTTSPAVEQPDATTIYNPYPVQLEYTKPAPVMVPDEDSYVTAHKLTDSEIKAQQIQEKFDAINRYNALMDSISVQNNPTHQYKPQNAPYVITPYAEGGFIQPKDAWDKLSLQEKSAMMRAAVRQGIYNLKDIRQKYNEFAEGGKIHIKPSHRGRLTELKERTGKSEAELYNDGNPAHKKMVVFARNARKWKHGDGGNLFAEAGQIHTSKPYYDSDGVLHYNRALPDIVITPDSEKSPGERAMLERERRRVHDAANGAGTYDATRSSDYTGLQQLIAQKEWENSAQKKALDYAQSIASGIGMGADIVSHLPIYSSLKGARVLSEAKTPTDYIEGGLWLAPIGNAAYQGVKPYAKKAATEAAIAWDLRNPEVPEDFQKIESISIPVNSKNIKETPFFKWGNDERFAVQPSKDTYKSIIEQLKEARNYKISAGYKDLVKRFTQESKNKNLIFNEDLFDNGNTTLSKLTLSDRGIGQLGEYFPQTNSIDLDIAQIGDLKVPFHEGIHWQRVGAPADKIGPKFEKWLEARRAGDPNEAQLFEEFRNSTEYERYYQRKAADKAIQDKVEEALYPSADETLRNRGELQAYGLEAGKAIGIEPFSEYPGIIDALTATEKARKYSPQLRDIKSGGEENVKRFWDILTGNYIPSTVIGAFGINSYLNK